MIVLGVETSTDACSVALRIPPRGDEDDERFVQSHRVIPRGHNREVLPMIDRIMRDAGVASRELAAVAFGAGPGSFTGVRIAAAVAQGIALATGCRAIGISSLVVLAARVLRREPGARVLVLQDARPGEVHAGLYETSGGEPKAVLPERRLRIEDLGAHVLAHSSGFLIVAGSANSRVTEVLGGDVRRAADVHPDAETLLALAVPRLERGEGRDAAEVELSYGDDGSFWRKA